MKLKNIILKDSVLFVVFILVVCVSCSKLKQEPLDETTEQRVTSLLNQMTLEEKLDYIGGENSMYIRAIERLGLPEIKMSDGPMGICSHGKSTCYPGGICLAATWNTQLATSFGNSVGNDARARGVHIWLAPGLNIYRTPLCGRNFEYFGEDPFLASKMAVALINGVQEKGILATPKHFVCNNQEYDRHNVSSNLDERTLREIYLPAFRASIKDAKAGCIMNAYNLLNGSWCTENDFLNNRILKKEWGFNGILMSDWRATHHAIAAANAGLDLEMPSGEHMNREYLMPALEKGEVSMQTIDDKVRRILRVIIRSGFLDRPQLDQQIPLDNPESSHVALQMAREGIVLLKNEKNTLPLEKNKIRTIAVLGPNAHPGVPAGGGSSFTHPFHTVSLLDGIRNISGNTINVIHDPGCLVPDILEIVNSQKLEHRNPDNTFNKGIFAEYFNGKDLSGEPVITTIVETINFDWADGSPEALPNDQFSARFSGTIRPGKTGHYIFAARSDDGVRIYLDKELVVDDWTDHPARVRTVMRKLDAGSVYDIRIDYYENTGKAFLQFGWQLLMSSENSPAVKLAAKSDVAVVSVGFNANEEFEGADRSFKLPGAQAEFIRAVADANPNTIVIINSGGAVDWNGWLDHVPALLQAWYPGQEGGTAIAELLFGIHNPSGKLPATFEKSEEENPAYPYYHSKDGKNCEYKEGVFVGYRGYDHQGIEPRFCFGHGLSYTTFEYNNLEIYPPAISSDQKVHVQFSVKNTGTREGAETSQIYIHDVKSGIPRPPKELKAFQKVFLNPGESKTLHLTLDKEVLSFFDPDKSCWIAEPGMFRILIGSSLHDIRLTGEFCLK